MLTAVAGLVNRRCADRRPPAVTPPGSFIGGDAELVGDLVETVSPSGCASHSGERAARGQRPLAAAQRPAFSQPPTASYNTWQPTPVTLTAIVDPGGRCRTAFVPLSATVRDTVELEPMNTSESGPLIVRPRIV